MTDSMTAGHAIAVQLELGGVERIFCVPGESYLEVLDGLRDRSIDVVTCRQEGGAGFMAVAHARLSGNPGVVMVTRGPGATNVSIAVHTAWQDASPLVVLVGLIPLAHVGRESFQEIDLVAFFGPMAKDVLVLTDPDDAAAYVTRALRLAVEGRPGPVVIGVHEDVLVQPTKVAERIAERTRATPPVDELGAAVSMLGAAHRPVVVLGGDGWSDDTATRIARCAESSATPVAADFRSYDLIDNNSSAYVGSLGFGRHAHLARIIENADLLVLLGGVRSDVMSDSYTLAKDVRTLVVGPDPDLMGHVGRVDRNVVADPADFAVAWEGAVLGVVDDDRRADLVASRRAHEVHSTPSPDGQRLDLGVAFARLRERLPGDSIVTYGAGCHAAWPTRFLPAHGTRSVLGPKNGAMGFGIPAAVAACLAHPGRQVVSVAGDGCFLMNGQELATAAAVGARPLVLVLDNGVFGTIALHQALHHPGRSMATHLVNPDFAQLAEAYGAYSERVEITEQFAPALDRALDSGRAALLHLVTDPALLLPPEVTLD